jgi:mono/diheme cytochrome c family protein
MWDYSQVSMPSQSKLLDSAIAPLTAFGVVIVVALLATTRPSAQAQSQARSIWDGVYSTAQAARGERAYRSACGYCHKDDLSGGFMDDGVGKATALAGPQAFGSSLVERWKDQSMGDLVYAIASTMPKDSPTSLTLDTYIDIATYLLQKNGMPAGSADLPADVPMLRAIAVRAKP